VQEQQRAFGLLQVTVLGQSGGGQQGTAAGLEGYPPEALAQMLVVLAPEARCMVLSAMPEAQRWQVGGRFGAQQPARRLPRTLLTPLPKQQLSHSPLPQRHCWPGTWQAANHRRRRQPSRRPAAARCRRRTSPVAAASCAAAAAQVLVALDPEQRAEVVTAMSETLREATRAALAPAAWGEAMDVVRGQAQLGARWGQAQAGPAPRSSAVGAEPAARARSVLGCD
jgi:hypothetical protein